MCSLAQKAKLGELHDLTLTMQAWNARVMYAEAVALDSTPAASDALCAYQAVVDGSVKLIGKQHPYSLNAKIMLTAALQALRKYQAARTELEDVVAGLGVNLGADHDET